MYRSAVLRIPIAVAGEFLGLDEPETYLKDALSRPFP
jgi:hypothetical protein